MAKLTKQQRKKLPASKFAQPSKRKYPIPDATHAVSAKSRARAQYEKGDLSKRAYCQVVAKANKVLGKNETCPVTGT